MELLAEGDPGDPCKLLDPVLERMMEAVHRYEGTVNQVMGDGIMALFGASLSHESRSAACYAARRMRTPSDATPRTIWYFGSCARQEGGPRGQGAHPVDRYVVERVRHFSSAAAQGPFARGEALPRKRTFVELGSPSCGGLRWPGLRTPSGNPSESRMRDDCTSGPMRRSERGEMVHSANGHRTRKGGSRGGRRTCTRPRSPFTLR
jgi:hypothetical protein